MTKTAPQLWLGTWSMGGQGFGPTDLGESRAVLETAFENGITHFDTANIYAKGQSETLLGTTFTHNRNKIFISTKGGLEWDGNTVVHNGSRNSLRESLFKSLDRLNTDHVELYQLHWPDPNTPLEDSIHTLKELQSENLIQHWGLGNCSATQLTAHIQPNETIHHQTPFNLLQPDPTILDAGASQNRCINCVYSPLAQGLLASGPAQHGLKHLGKKDLRRRNPLFRDDKILEKAGQHHQKSKELKIPPEQLALQWVLDHPKVDVVIIGPRKVAQVESLLDNAIPSIREIEIL